MSHAKERFESLLVVYDEIKKLQVRMTYNETCSIDDLNWIMKVRVECVIRVNQARIEHYTSLMEFSPSKKTPIP